MTTYLKSSCIYLHDIIGGLFYLNTPSYSLFKILSQVGLPACSWAATLTTTLMLLMTGTLSSYRIPSNQVTAPKCNLHCCSQWEDGNTTRKRNTDVGLQDIHSHTPQECCVCNSRLDMHVFIQAFHEKCNCLPLMTGLRVTVKQQDVKTSLSFLPTRW